MKKSLFLFFLLSSCAGGFTGGGDLAPPGGGIGADNPPPVVVAGASGSDGVLGSQSSSSDIDVQFYRDYALDFEGETDIHEVVVERPMVQSTQAYGDATVRKIAGPSKSLGNSTSTATTSNVGVSGVSSTQAALLQTWVRAINCGNFPDSEIEALIPPSEQEKPWAQDKLLWLILHLPRPDSPVTVECRNPTYRDFPIEALQKVDLAALKGSPQDLFFFVRVNLSDFGPAGELSLDTEKPLSDEQWLELAKKFKLRIVRLLPAGTPSRIHAIPKLHLNPN